MKKRSAPPPGRIEGDAKTGMFVIGHARFSKISAVEGIELTPATKTRKAQLDSTEASAAERREAIIKAHKR